MAGGQGGGQRLARDPERILRRDVRQAGWDSVTVDMQHGVQDYLSCVACFQGMQPLRRDADGARAMERAGHHRQGAGRRRLWRDLPDGEHRGRSARAGVSTAKYPPKGTRSNGPIRAGLYGEAGNYQKTANDEILVIPMIETQTAIDNIDAILDVPGIDAIYVGPSDLAFSLGMEPKLDWRSPRS